jgi:Short C-terminal domain
MQCGAGGTRTHDRGIMSQGRGLHGRPSNCIYAGQACPRHRWGSPQATSSRRRGCMDGCQNALAPRLQGAETACPLELWRNRQVLDVDATRLACRPSHDPFRVLGAGRWRELTSSVAGSHIRGSGSPSARSRVSATPMITRYPPIVQAKASAPTAYARCLGSHAPSFTIALQLTLPSSESAREREARRRSDMFTLILLVVAGTSVWVAIDANNLGVQRGVLGGGALDMGPGGWFFSCLLLWLLCFPLYLSTRPRYLEILGTRRAPRSPTYPHPPNPALWQGHEGRIAPPSEDGSGVYTAYAQTNPLSPKLQNDSLVTQVSRLSELRQSGALTEDEFLAIKARLLTQPS